MKKGKNKLNKIQEIELDIFKAIQKYCKENNVLYFACGGTCLGAVRHKGFIPWDDDIDIAMLRSEFNKFYNLLKTDRYIDEEKRYKALLPLDEGHIYPFIKIVDTKTIAYEKSIAKKYATGIWVDVFPYDYGADNNKDIKRITLKHGIYKKFFQVGISGELNFKQKVLKVIAFIPYKILTRGDYTYWVKKMMSLSSANPTKYIGGVVWARDDKDFFPAEWFEDYTELEFEDVKLRVISHYDEWLTHFYGDYMKLPKEEDRQVHGFEWHYIEKDKKK